MAGWISWIERRSRVPLLLDATAIQQMVARYASAVAVEDMAR